MFNLDEKEYDEMMEAEDAHAHDDLFHEMRWAKQLRTFRAQLKGIVSHWGAQDTYNSYGFVKRSLHVVKGLICLVLGRNEGNGAPTYTKDWKGEAFTLYTMDSGHTGGSWEQPPDPWWVDLCVPTGLRDWFLFEERE